MEEKIPSLSGVIGGASGGALPGFFGCMTDPEWMGKIMIGAIIGAIVGTVITFFVRKLLKKIFG